MSKKLTKLEERAIKLLLKKLSKKNRMNLIAYNDFIYIYDKEPGRSSELTRLTGTIERNCNKSRFEFYKGEKEEKKKEKPKAKRLFHIFRGRS